jgi:hypothetical protein
MYLAQVYSSIGMAPSSSFIRWVSDNRGGKHMTKISLIAALGIITTLGAVSGAYADNPSVPSWSPYAIMDYDATLPSGSFRMEAHLAAQVDRDYASDTTVPNTNVPTWTPYAILPMGR